MTVTEVEYCSVVKEVETQLKKEVTSNGHHPEEKKTVLEPTKAQEEDPAKKPFQREIVWFNAIGFLILHLAAIYGFVHGVLYGKFPTYVWSE
jgi:hypothetical protein